MATNGEFMKTAAHYTNIWRDESPVFHRHNVDALQSLFPMNYYVITVPSQHSSSYAERRILLCAKRAGFRTAISCHHLQLLSLQTRLQAAIIVLLSLFNHRVNKKAQDFDKIWHLLCCIRCHSQSLTTYCSLLDLRMSCYNPE